jgi:hypothetical protein
MKKIQILLFTTCLVIAGSALMATFFEGRSVTAAPPERFGYDTGYVTLGEDQFIRITVALGDTGTHEVRFRALQANATGCTGAVCAHQVVSQSTSQPFSITANSGLSTDLYSANPGQGVRGIVISSHKELRVTMQIIDSTTNELLQVIPLGSYSFGASNLG